MRSLLRKPVRAYFAAAPQAQCDEALDMVRRVADHLALMLLDGACREAVAGSLPTLRRLLVNPGVSERAKWHIEALGLGARPAMARARRQARAAA